MKKYDNKGEIQKGAASIIDNAQSFLKGTKTNVVEMASKAKKVWAYFNNDRNGYAIKNAKSLLKQLKGF